ncbi:MAG: NAD(P)H-dependent oxidoreductase [Lachnospiraceae bacterium]|nr:NAD(P)H-dependent oxidoreductase [Lachnospiraceae bacterium]
MGTKELLVIYPQRKGADKARARLDEVLDHALEGLPVRVFERLEELFDTEAASEEGLSGRRLLFAVPLGADGINHGYYELLAWLRAGLPKRRLAGCIAGLLIDADSELYTKSVARELAAAANRAGCAFFGRPLTEATASLDNFLVQAANLNTDRLGAYKNSARVLAEQVLTSVWEKKAHPRLLVLHASNHRTSNTMALWEQVQERLAGVEIRELNLRNGTLEDCSGCPYQMCLHFGERGQCFYGGAMVEDVYPAVKWADGLLLLCPNYNDALSANLTAFINRLTALFRTMRFYEKAVFAIVVSGYSGSDLIEEQLIGALNMNKTFYLPGNFCMLETGNSPGSALRSQGIETRLEEFAAMVQGTLLEMPGMDK